MIGRRAAALGFAAAGLTAWAGCQGERSASGGDPGPSSSGNATGGRAGTASRRIVSISPSASETVFALGRGAELVGRSTYCDEPPDVKRVAEVGGFADPSLERIVALSPTLVVGERGPAGPRLIEALEQRGISTYFPPITSMVEIQAFITGLGERIDAVEPARKLVMVIDRELESVEATWIRARRPRVLFLFDFRPLVVAGPGSFPDEVLRRAGGENVVVTGGMYPTLGAEGLLALDPEIVIDGSTPGAQATDPLELLRGIAGLETLRAVREKRVGRLLGTSALRPGPRIGEGVREVSKLIASLMERQP